MKRIISRRRFLTTLGLSGAGMVGLSSYGFAVEASWRLDVTRYRISPANWPRNMKLSIGVIADVHAGGPAMPAERIREIVEPYLLQQGFIGRTPRGRVLTLRAYKHLGLTGPARAATPQIGLFDESTEGAPGADESGGKAGTG